jgi:hypothetical protein
MSQWRFNNQQLLLIDELLPLSPSFTTISLTASWKASHVNRSVNFCTYHVVNWAARGVGRDSRVCAAW